ncbi:family 2A encapsulin nanocompartment cargo protein cysteine desulfurase [Dechloromonas hortensis]|uniref:family 2A encapsulin nanocompartment cargo protein cysteine desulfurase n=1 Tax=Dechloromonas hortensis TaxID=337779 RepID=UPI001291A3CE|nr:family 2A encapsulin nanocompartment cargo protein cysteine desulfurase [Dechloromonas hortensis]
MNIPTPTSNGVEGLGGGLPSGLPDEATLGRLASEFFRRLPGAPEPSLHFAESAQSTSLGTGSEVGKFAAPEPSLIQSGPRGAPLPIAPDPVDPLGSGGAEFGVPEAYAASLPSVTPPQPPSQFAEQAPVSPSAFASTSPYYFLGEASPYTQSGGAPAKPENRVVAQSFGLPGQGELLALLADIGSDRKSADSGGQPQQSGNFYFLDAAKVPDAGPTARPAFDVNAVRRDFPILQERVNGKPLVWFDNAATTQKPQSVIDRLAYFYAHENSNIHRAAHELAARATDAYEAARNKVQRFLGAGSANEIIFVRGATEAINLVAKTWGVANIVEGDEIVVSLLEHHANIVPWQQLAAQVGAKIRVIPVDDTGQLKLDELQKLLNPKTKLVSVTQVSNALGTVTPIKQVIDMAHAAGAKVLVDGAQSVSHLRVNVQALDADFFVFSGHKIFGPTGIGVVYGKAALLEQMPPWQGGGNMIADVTFEKTLFQAAPNKFEAGTGNIADAVGLGAALDYVERIGIENIARYEHDLLVYATRGLSSIPGVRLIGTAADKASVASFVLAGYSTEEVGRALNEEGIAVRSGHHCAQPILRRFGVEATVRPSLAFYNTCEEIDRMLAVVRRLARGKGKIAA